MWLIDKIYINLLGVFMSFVINILTAVKKVLKHFYKCFIENS